MKDLSFSYDHSGRMLNIYDNMENRKLSSYQYNKLSLVTTQTNFNGTSSEFQYDPNRYWMTDLKVKKGTQTIYENTYEYDSVGNRKRLIDEYGNETLYEYDGLYRLTGVQGEYYKRADGSYNSFSYDTTGNRLTYKSKYNSYQYQYATGSNRLTVEKSMAGEEILAMIQYQYDANGNTTMKERYNGLIKIGYEQYSWNGQNQMARYEEYEKNIKTSASFLLFLSQDVNFLLNENVNFSTPIIKTPVGQNFIYFFSSD